MWGRAAALGTPPADLVVATFGVFQPGFLTGVYESGRAAVSRDDVLAARADGASASLRRILGDAADLAPVADTLMDALLSLDATARPLFAGLRSLPLPDSVHGRLWRATELVREHRGDGHLAACIAAGLDPVAMTVLTELWLGYPAGMYLGRRGYGPDALAAGLDALAQRGWVDGEGLTDDGRSARLAIEEATDVTQAPLVAALGGSVDWVVERTSAWSALVVEGGSFPTDPRKRAAG